MENNDLVIVKITDDELLTITAEELERWVKSADEFDGIYPWIIVERLQLIKARESGYNTYQVVDENGNHLIKRDKKHSHIIKSHGIRIIDTNKLWKP